MAAELVRGAVFMTSGNFTEKAKSFSAGGKAQTDKRPDVIKR